MVKIYEEGQQNDPQDTVEKELEKGDTLCKYIHLTEENDSETVECSDKLINTNDQNFLVYTLTGIDKDRSMENNGNKKEKKSSEPPEGRSKSPRTSHLFSFVSKLKKNRMEGKQIQESTEILLLPKNIDLKTSSKIPIHLKRLQSKVNIHNENNENGSCVCTSEFGSFITAPDAASAGTSRCSSLEEICVQTNTFSNMTVPLTTNRKNEETTNVIATSYVEKKHVVSNTSITNNLQEVSDQIKKMEESEKYIFDTLAKYINDQSFKIELKEFVANYVKQHIDTERKAQNLSHQIWEQKIELDKTNEINYKNTIDNLVKKNRKLHEENEALNKKNELLSSKALAMENSGMSYPHRNSYVVEGLNRANDKLRIKLSAAKGQVETIDNQMQKLKEKNSVLDDQAKTFNSQLSQNIDILRRTKNDHELEVDNLYSEIKNKSDTIGRNKDAVKILVEEINKLMIGASFCNNNINIETIQINKDSCENVSHIIDTTCSYLRELYKELQHLETDQNTKETNLKQLSSENTTLLEKISELKMQCENLKEKLKQKEELIINNFDTEQTVKELRQTLQSYKTDIDEKAVEIHAINEKYSELCREKQESDNQVENMKEETNTTALERNHLQQENSFLKLQLQELNSLLFTTGTANISRDLKILQDQLALLHEKCSQLDMDKKSLKDKIRQQESERQTLTIYQDNCYTYFQELQKEVEKISINNEQLKTKLEDKKSEIAVLQADKKRYLEEKEVLKQIYEKLKAESTKVIELEGTVTNINKEALRLAKIADYNKQLGEKLKTEVVERDEEINHLKNNLDKLNEIQEENVKEKVSLCEELTEICNWKDVLDNKLAVEVQRNMMLAEYRNEIENNARNQIETIEERYLKQSNELDMLTDKYRILESENEQFKTQLQIKVEKMLSMECREQSRNSDFETIRSQLDESKNIVADHNITIDSLRAEINDVSTQLQFQITSNQKVVQDLQNKIMSDSGELENMDRTIQYLQNNMQKLQNDLDNSRASQKDQDLIFEKEKHKSEVLQLTLEQKLKIIEDFENERQKELRKIDSLTCAYNKLSAEYEADIKRASNEQKIDKENFDAVKEELIEKKCEIKNLKDKIEDQSLQKGAVQDECAQLQKHINNFRQLSDELDNKTLLLSESSFQQEKTMNQLEKERQESEKLQNKYIELKKKTELLRKDLHLAEKSVIENKKQFKICFDDLEHEFMSQKDIMYKDLVTMHDRVKEISTDYINQRNTRVKYEEAHKALAEKLLKSVKMLVEEKISRQTSENKILEISEKNAYLQRDLTVLQEKNNEMKEASEELKEELKNEHDIYKNLCKKYNEEKTKRPFRNLHDEESGELKKLIDQISLSVLPLVSNAKSSQDVTPRCFSRQKSKLQTKIQTYKVSLEKSHKNYMKLQEELGGLQEKYTVLDFQKSEMVLRLHETQVRLGVHENMVLELKEINRNVLTLVLKMREDGTLERCAAETLIFLMRS